MTYKGFRLRDGTCRVTRDGKKLDLHLELRNHSPTGFEWGYGGSGPAQTALAILYDFLQDPRHVCDPETCGEHSRNCVDYERSFQLYMKFKWEVVARLPHRGWSISDKFLRAWIKVHEEDAAA